MEKATLERDTDTLTVGVRFHEDFQVIRELFDKLGSQDVIIQKFKEFYLQVLEKNLRLDIVEMQVIRSVNEWLIITRTNETVLRRLAFNALTTGANSLWYDFATELGIEVERSPLTLNFFVTTDPALGTEQLILAQEVDQEVDSD